VSTRGGLAIYCEESAEVIVLAAIPGRTEPFACVKMMKVTKGETKEGTKREADCGCCQRRSAEHGKYDRAPIDQRMTELDDTNAPITEGLMEKIADRDNLNTAYKHVKRNKGSGGVDKIEMAQLLPYLKEHAPEIRQSLMDGTYRPSPVLGVEIPKENGDKRRLGIPTLRDRVIQQAIMQQLTEIYEPQFADASFGFRPNRSCHDALKKSQEYLNQGYVWTVDMDLEKFFDTVNQSKLVEVLSRSIKDGRVISLIHRFMRAGAIWWGKYEETKQGVPQGGPLSPLLANILLNELDHELEARGHRFVRYADDMIIFCKSKASAVQALEHITPFIERKLFLKVNRVKTVVAYASKIKFLGYSFYKTKQGFRFRVHQKSQAKLREKLKELTSRRRITTLDEWMRRLKLTIIGWVNYYKLADMRTFLQETDKWLRRRIRMVFWKRWKRIGARYNNLRRLGISEDDAKKQANTRKGLWRTANSPILKCALNNDKLERVGFTYLSKRYSVISTL